MTNDKLALYGALVVAAGLSLAYFPAGLVFLGFTMVLGAFLRAYTSGGQEG